MKEGDIVNVFTDYMYNKGFQGVAVLKEFSNYGRTNIYYNEKLFTKPENKAYNKVTLKQTLTKEEKENNKIYYDLLKLFNTSDIKDNDFKEVILDLKNSVSEKIENYEKLKEKIIKYQFSFYNSLEKKRELFCSINPRLIRNFLLQTELKNFSFTLWREENWLVEFIPDQYCIEKKWVTHTTPFRAYRKFNVLVAINLKEDSQSCTIRSFENKKQDDED